MWRRPWEVEIEECAGTVTWSFRICISHYTASFTLQLTNSFQSVCVDNAITTIESD